MYMGQGGAPLIKASSRAVINSNALLGVVLGTSGLMYTMGKKPPDILLLAGLLIGSVTLANDIIEVVEYPLDPTIR